MKKRYHPVIFALALFISVLSGCPVIPPDNPPAAPPQTGLAAPGGVKATAGDYAEKIVLTWEKVSNAGSYRIYRQQDCGFTEIGLSDTTAYGDTMILQGVHYNYKIQAAAAGYENNAFSEVASGWSACTLSASTVLVLDSLCGTVVEGASVRILEKGFSLYTGITNKQGEIAVPLDPRKTYDLVASGKGLASSRLQAVSVKTNNSPLALYCHDLGMAGCPDWAPEVVSLEYSKDNIVYQPLPAGSTVALYDFNYIAIKVHSGNIIPDAHSENWGFLVNFDGDTAQPGHLLPAALFQETKTGDCYVIKGVFNLSGAVFMNGAITLHFTAYDLARNCVEYCVPFTLTCAELRNDPDLAGVEPCLYDFYAETFGNSLELTPMSRGFEPYENTAASYKVYLYYQVNDSKGNPVQIRKADFYRSTDDLHYDLAGSVNFRELACSNSYVFYDNDPGLNRE